MCTTPGKTKYTNERSASDALTQIKITAALHPGRPSAVKRRNKGKTECRYYRCGNHFHLTSQPLREMADA